MQNRSRGRETSVGLLAFSTTNFDRFRAALYSIALADLDGKDDAGAAIAMRNIALEALAPELTLAAVADAKKKGGPG